MNKVDSLGWADSIAFSAHGLRVGLRVNEQGASRLEEYRSFLAAEGWNLESAPEVDILFSLKVGGQTRRRGVRNYHLCYLNAQQVARSEDLDEVQAALNEHLLFVRTAYARDAVFVNAGLVEYGERLMLLPGTEETGLGGLLEALAERGATILSEKYTVLDPEGRVNSFPERDSTRPVGLVAFTEYSPKIRAFRPRGLTPGQASLNLFAQAISARSNPSQALGSLSKLCMSTPSCKGRRGDPHQAAQTLLRKL